MRYKFYREHKYVCAAINDVERLIAKTDFTLATETAKVKEAFDALLSMLKGHADYENSRLHRLLHDRGSDVYRHVEEEHRTYDQKLNDLGNRLMLISESIDPKERIGVLRPNRQIFRKTDF
jgi:hemerythrin-like domain-containing protein